VRIRNYLEPAEARTRFNLDCDARQPCSRHYRA
jgi:hypothetical protein